MPTIARLLAFMGALGLCSAQGCAHPAVPRPTPSPPELEEGLQEGSVYRLRLPAKGKLGEPVHFSIEGSFGVSVATLKEVRVERQEERLIRVRVLGHWYYETESTASFPCVCTPFHATASFVPDRKGVFLLTAGQASATLPIE